jgi:hypothetical protein
MPTRYDAPLALDSTCACSDADAKGSWVDTEHGPRFVPTKGSKDMPSRGDELGPLAQAQARAEAQRRKDYEPGAPSGSITRIAMAPEPQPEKPRPDDEYSAGPPKGNATVTGGDRGYVSEGPTLRRR